MIKVMNNLVAIIAFVIRFNFNIIVIGIIYLIGMDTFFPVLTAEHPNIIAFIGALIACFLDRWTLRFWRSLFNN